jgi:AmiR/NasT family two-component response regulator
MSAGVKPLRALICEDEGITAMALRKALQRAGYEVASEVADGERCVELVRELEPDFILMDINIPGMNGIAATRKIMQRRPVPIIMLTAYGDEKSVEQALDAGACYYLVKPVGSEQLIPAIKTAIVRFEALESVRQENESLKEQLETRKLVERAKGILTERMNLTEADAFRRMQKTSRDRCQTMKQTALDIINAANVLS